MDGQVVQRGVVRVDRPGIERGHADSHRVRQLVPPGDWDGSDPFLLLMEDWFSAGVFEPHPHRGIETLTVVLDGELEHYDNHGHQGRIGEGDALLLTAGRGIVHDERPVGGEAHILQLWINLPRASKLVPARYQELRADALPVRREPGVLVRVLAGASADAVAPTLAYAPFTVLDVRIEAGATFTQELPAGYNGFIVGLEGQGLIGSSATSIREGQVAWLTQTNALSTVALSAETSGMRAMLFAGKPLREPVAARGPFVMNTPEELNAGYAEFRATRDRFGL